MDGLPADPQVEGQHLQGDHEDDRPHLPPQLPVAEGEGGAANLLEEFQKPLRPVPIGLTYIANGGFSWWYRGGPNGSSLRSLLKEPNHRGIYVCKALLDAIFVTSIPRGVGGHKEGL